MSWCFSVLVDQLLRDSSAAINVLQLPLLYFLSLFYALRDSLPRSLKRIRDSRSRFTNEIAFSIIQWFCHKIKIPGSPQRKHWLYCYSNRERAHYYISIMRGSFEMPNSGEIDVYGWTILAVWYLSSKRSYLPKCGWLFRKVEWVFHARYQLKPSDRSKLNWSIKEHRGMVEKLTVILKDLKEHDSTLFQTNGLALKQGENFFHSLNVKQIKCVEAKLTEVRENKEALENKKRSYDRTFKTAYTNSTSTKGEGKKENRRKLTERKRKRTENNVQRIHWICVGNLLGNLP